MKFIIAILLFVNILISQTDVNNLFSSLSDQPDSIKIKKYSEFCWNNRNSNPNDAIIAGKEALILAEKSKNYNMVAKINNYLGVIYRNIGSIENAVKYFHSALNVSKELNDSIQIAYSYNNIGGIYRIQNNFTQAFDNILKSMQIFEKLGNKNGVAYCTINLGIIYYRQKKYDKALDYLNKTVKLREEIDDEWGKAVALNHIAELYFDKGELDLAMEIYNKLIILYNENNDLKGLSAAYGGIAGVYYDEGKYKLAEANRLKAIKIAKSIDFIDGLITNYNNLALVNAQLGKKELSKKYLDSSKTLIDENNYTIQLLNYYKTFAEFSKITNDYQGAIEYLQLYEKHKDSITSEENKLWMTEMETIYNVEKKQKEYELLEAELNAKNIQRNYLFVITLLSIILVIVISSKYYSNKKASKKLLYSNKEKDALFRILAHDLKNPFNSLLGLSDLLRKNFDDFDETEKKDAVEEINRSSKKLYELVKNLLDWIKAQTDGTKSSIEYIDIEDLVNNCVSLFLLDSKNKKINIKINIEENLRIESDPDILQTIIRNIISNSIKFTRENGVVEIKVTRESENLIFKIIDNGVGMNESEVNNLFKLEEGFSKKGTQNETGTGIGLIIVKELINKLNGKIKVNSKINIGTEFIIIIPLKHEV